MAAVGILAVSMLAGCGSSKVTAVSLLEDVQKKCDSMKSMETHTTADITLDSAALGGSMDMTMDMTMQTTTDPVANYMKGSIGILGQTLDMENYIIVNGDQIDSYTGMSDQWVVQKMSYDEDSVEKINAAAEDLLKSKDSLKLADETEDVDGTEAYIIITGSISGEDVKNLMGSMESTLGSLTGDEDMDFGDISVDFTYAISKADKNPLYMDMTFNGMTAGEGDEQVTFSKFNMKMEYTNFDTVDEITVPQDVIDSASDITDYMNQLQSETSSDTETSTETETQTESESAA